MTQAEKFIRENWVNTIRTCTEDEGTLIALPKPFTIPTMRDRFQEMYYWDTYFANVGLILSHMAEQAKNNTDNVAYLINKYGFMPNGNRTGFLTRSQPPFFSLMVRDVYQQTGDKVWLRQMYLAACKEHVFWQTSRQTPCGLNRYYGIIPEGDRLRKVAAGYARRARLACPEDEAGCRRFAEIYLALCECGWDCSSRCGRRPHEYAWVDLNALLYALEDNLAFFAEELGIENSWRQAAEERKALVNRLCWNDALGAFCDYDFINEKTSDFVSCAAFYPLLVGLATPEQAARTVKLLDRLEFDHGVAGCEQREDLLGFQWDYPLGWACLHYIVVAALERCGYHEDARRIAAKYCALVDRNYEVTGNLWEKYNVVTGTVGVDQEHGNAAPTNMMGWSAGVYLYCLKMKA